MIAPDVRVVDVEPDGFGVLCTLAATYDRPTRGELHVLHDGGQVRRVVHTLNGPLQEHHEPLGDNLPRRAAELRELAGVDRVVLVERSGLVAQADAFAAAGPGSVDQPTALRRSNEVFWSSPAVVTDPAAPHTGPSWERLEQHLRDLGSNYRALLAGYDGDRCSFTLLAHLVQGRVVHLTSLRGLLGDQRPPASDAAALVHAAETLGPVPLVLIANNQVLRDVAASPDIPAALAACGPQALTSRGLPT